MVLWVFKKLQLFERKLFVSITLESAYFLVHLLSKIINHQLLGYNTNYSFLK